MNKVFKNVLVVFLLTALFVASTGIVLAAPAAATATTYRPLGNTYTNKPKYSWSLVTGTTKYKLQVAESATGKVVISAQVASSACNSLSGLCAFTPAAALSYNKAYRWRVAAGTAAFSAWNKFTTLPGFDAQFANTNLTSWTVRPGGKWAVASGSLQTNGVANKWSSISYNGNFDNYTVSARMKRVSTTGGASGFWVRGKNPTFDTSFNAVKSAYLFLYSQNGCFSVWKHVDGTYVVVQDWTISPSIVENGWNVLKVTADGSKLKFTINNSLVWAGSDTSFRIGQVALTMFRSSTEKLSVDWVKLGMSDLYTVTAPGSEAVEQGQVQITPDPSQPDGPEQAPVLP